MVPPYGGEFVARSTVLDASGVRRALTRIGHEIVERNHGLENVAVVALQTGGVRVGMRLVRFLFEIDGVDVPFGTLDVAMHRDDVGLRPVVAAAPTDMDFDPNGMIIVLVDDVLFTGRTVRAALDALNDFGRPAAVQLAVVVDRGHRELPIRPDFVGKNLPTSQHEVVDVSLEGVMLGEMRK